MWDETELETFDVCSGIERNVLRSVSKISEPGSV